MQRFDRQRIVELRRQGKTYQDLIHYGHVAKSTVWRWLKAEGLVETHPQRLTELRRAAQRKAAETVHRNRLERTRVIVSEAAEEVGRLASRELQLIGAALYWAEGAKQKESKNRVSELVLFSNTDPRMLRLFVKFLQECCGIPASDLSFRIYLHETADGEEARRYWSEQLQIAALHQAPITWKHHKTTTNRTNVGNSYHGLLRIVVRKSTNLNRRITGWVDGICCAVGE